MDIGGRRVPPCPLTVLQRRIDQLPAGDQVLQHVFEALAVLGRHSLGWRRGGRLGLGRLGLAERRQHAVVIGIDEAVVDAFLVGALDILVIAIDAQRLAVIQIGRASCRERV